MDLLGSLCVAVKVISCLCIFVCLCIISFAHLFGYDLCNEHVMISVIINDMRFVSMMVFFIVWCMYVCFLFVSD